MQLQIKPAILFQILLVGFLQPYSIAGQESPTLLKDSLNQTCYAIDLARSELKPMDGSDLCEARGALIRSVDLVAGEIIIKYVLPERINYPIDNFSPQYWYTVTPRLFLDGSPLEIHPKYLLGEVGEVPTDDELKTIYWTHLVQDHVNLRGILTVELRVREESDLASRLKLSRENCENLSFKYDWAHYAAGLAGAGLITWGVIEKTRSNSIYDNDYRNSTNNSEARPFYDEANQKHRNFILLTSLGSGILAADMIWYFIRLRKYKRRKENCRLLYQSGLVHGFEPLLEGPSDRAPEGLVGLRFRTTIGK